MSRRRALMLAGKGVPPSRVTLVQPATSRAGDFLWAAAPAADVSAEELVLGSQVSRQWLRWASIGGRGSGQVEQGGDKNQPGRCRQNGSDAAHLRRPNMSLVAATRRLEPQRTSGSHRHYSYPPKPGLVTVAGKPSATL